jgi:hypothetical protein
MSDCEAFGPATAALSMNESSMDRPSLPEFDVILP